MKKKWFSLLIGVMILTMISGCEKKAAVIKIKEEPLIIEAYRGEFDYDIIFDYVSIENGNGNKLDNELLEIEGTVNPGKTGTYPLTLKVNYNGKVTEALLEVRVEDTQPPMIHFIDKEILLLAGETDHLEPTQLLISAYDNYDGLITERIASSGEIDFETEGNYLITFEAVDTSGNSAQTEVNVRVTKSVEEYGRYLYDAATNLYWGNYYLFDDSLSAPDNKMILNHEDIMDALLTVEMRRTFEEMADAHENPQSEGIAVTISSTDGKYYSVENNHQNRLDYNDTVLVVKSQSNNRIVFTAVSSYISSNEEYEESKSFILEKEDGYWKISEYHFPN